MGKRQYRIENGECLQMYESESALRDEVLAEVLSAPSSGQLKTIVSSIQREQNVAIRNASDRRMLIQGPAGSGKTSVGLHRLAYLLYHRRDRLRGENVVVLSNSGVFRDYIGGLLPELGEEGLRQLVFSDLLEELAGCPCESWYDQAERLAVAQDSRQTEAIRKKHSKEFVSAVLEGFQRHTFRCPELRAGEELLLSAQEFEERLQTAQYSSFALAAEAGRREIRHRFENHLRDHRERLLTESLAQEDVLNAREAEIRLQAWCRQATEGAIREFEEKNHVDPAWHLQRLRSLCGETPIPPTERLTFADGLLLALVRLLLGMTKPDARCAHVLIDEAQDYSPLQMTILRLLWPQSEFTLLADPEQAVTVGAEDLPWAFQDGLRVVELKKSYRSTAPINVLAHGLLGDEAEAVYFDRAGELPRYQITPDRAAAIRAWLATEPVGTVGIITPDLPSAEALARELGDLPGVQTLTSPAESMTQTCVICPLLYAKGLEFDTVIAVDTFRAHGAGSPLCRRRLYLTATRALHRLIFVESAALPETYAEAARWMAMV